MSFSLLLLIGTLGTASAETYLVLPFFNYAKNSSLEWIGESLAENIRETLSTEGVLTLEREDRQEAYRRLSIKPYSTLTRASIIRIGELLDADAVVFGTFELLPDSASNNKGKGTLKILAQILEIRKARRGPEFTEVGELDQLADLQTHLAWQTLQFVTPKTAPSEEEFRSKRAPIRVDAIESYVRGLLANTSDQKLKLFTQAVRLDPRYSQANFQLGRMQFEKKAYKPAAEALQRVTSGDAHAREALFFLGLSRFRTGDYDGAEAAFRNVVEVVPLNEVWNNLGAAQSRRNSPEALGSFQKALEGDSRDPDYQYNVGLALFKRGDLEAAADKFRATLDRSPGDADATTMLGRCLRPAARPAARLEATERLKENYEESAYLQLKNLVEPKK